MIKILVCDDDDKIIETSSKLLTLFQKNNKIEFEVDIRKSGDFILKEKLFYNIAFIDIEMPGIGGLKLAEELKNINHDILVIIITSFNGYLDDAMRINVFRYLSKPIDSNRFNLCFTEAIKVHTSICKNVVIENSLGVSYIKTKDILYIESKKRGSIITTKNKVFESKRHVKEWSEIINLPSCFVFSHNSFLVNLQNVIDFNKTTVTLRSSDNKTETIYMSQRKYLNFKKSFFVFARGIK